MDTLHMNDPIGASNTIKEHQVIISINGKPQIIKTLTSHTTGYDLYSLITSRYGITSDYYYITNAETHTIIPMDVAYLPFINLDNKINTYRSDTFLNVSFRLKGGVFKKIFESIFKVIFAVFTPIIKPIQAIANGFLLLIKGILYMISLTIWFIKLMIWFFVQFLPSLPFDLILLMKQLVMLIVSSVIETISTLIGRVVNWFGRQTIYSMSAGWDNARDSDMKTNNESGTVDPNACKQHCYRTPDGAIPFSVVVVTVLCPPVGVFMEYGMVGWLKILVCFILTLMLYFPGLIYALMLLYC